MKDRWINNQMVTGNPNLQISAKCKKKKAGNRGFCEQVQSSEKVNK
jgi:hypothetical protein